MRLLALAVLTSALAAAQPTPLTDFAARGADGVETVLSGRGLAEVDGVVYFPAEGPDDIRAELWQYDPETGVTSQAADFSGATASGVLEVAALDGLVYAVPSAGSDDQTLQAYDPATGQAAAVRDLANPSGVGLTAVGGRLFFVDRTDGGEFAPHLYDPSTGVTTRVGEAASVTANTSRIAVVGGVVFYFGTSNAGNMLYQTDTATGATVEFASEFIDITLPVAFEGALYAGVRDPSGSGSEREGLVRKDLATGATEFIDAFPGRDLLAPPAPFAAVGDVLLLTVALPGQGVQIYRYDPDKDPVDATTLIAELGETVATSRAVVVGDAVYLVATSFDPAVGSSGLEPATLDPQTGEITLLANYRGGDSGFQNGYLVVGDAVYFSAFVEEGSSRAELFVVGGGATDAEAPPAAVRLGLPFPTPSAGRVTVPLGLDGPASVRATLHDVLGRTVAVLHDGPASDGTALVVDAARLAPGRYVVRVAADGVVVARSLTVVR